MKIPLFISDFTKFRLYRNNPLNCLWVTMVSQPGKSRRLEQMGILILHPKLPKVGY